MAVFFYETRTQITSHRTVPVPLNRIWGVGQVREFGSKTQVDRSLLQEVH